MDEGVNHCVCLCCLPIWGMHEIKYKSKTLSYEDSLCFGGYAADVYIECVRYVVHGFRRGVRHSEELYAKSVHCRVGRQGLGVCRGVHDVHGGSRRYGRGGCAEEAVAVGEGYGRALGGAEGRRCGRGGVLPDELRGREHEDAVAGAGTDAEGSEGTPDELQAAGKDRG